jgi:hypothetical protein
LHLNPGRSATRTFWGPTTNLIGEMVVAGVCGEMDSPLNQPSYPHFVTLGAQSHCANALPGVLLILKSLINYFDKGSKNKIEKIFLFGDARFYQKIAIEESKKLGIDTFVFV